MKVVLAGKGKALVQIILSSIKRVNAMDLFILPIDSDNGSHDWQVSVRKVCEIYSLNIINYNDAKALENSVFISVQFDKILRPHEFKTNKIYNIHFSYLPYYKGVYPIVWPLLNQEEFTGVTLHYIDAGIDTGDIIDHEKILLDRNVNSLQLYLECCNVALLLFERNFENLISDLQIVSSKQNRFVGSYYSKNSLSLSEFKIDLRKTAAEVSAQLRGLMFKPYQMPKINNYEVNDIQILTDNDYSQIGKIIHEDEICFMISTINFIVNVKKDFSNDIFNLLEKKNYDAVLRLLDLIDVKSVKNKLGWSPLMHAAYYGEEDFALELIKLGADVNETNFKGTSILMFAKTNASITGNLNLLDILVNNGCAINHNDDYGLSALHYAKVENNQDVIKYFENIS